VACRGVHLRVRSSRNPTPGWGNVVSVQAPPHERQLELWWEGFTTEFVRGDLATAAELALMSPAGQDAVFEQGVVRDPDADNRVRPEFHLR